MMRYCKDYRCFKTKHWKHLWESNIPDLDSLRKIIGTEGFVAIDAEPWGNGGPSCTDVSEIGVAFVPPIAVAQQQRQQDATFPTLESLVSRHHIHSHCLRIAGRARAEQRRETYDFGQAQIIAEDEVEEELVRIVSSFETKTGAKPVLVGFSLGFELRAISVLYPRLTDHFSSWVDLQELATEVSGLRTPAMRDTLIALGFDKDFCAVRSVRMAHNAGNDAVRILGVLFGLTSLSTDLSIDRTPKHKMKHWKTTTNVKKRTFWRHKPRPRELYPYIARVKLGSDLEKFTPETLYDYFSTYTPTAAGINQGNRYGWICLPCLDDLHRFVHEVHGKEEAGEVWTAILDFDPLVEGVETSAELLEMRRAKQEAQKENKRLERMAKQADRDLEDLIADFDLEET